jgi:hypothetical protein
MVRIPEAVTAVPLDLLEGEHLVPHAAEEQQRPVVHRAGCAVLIARHQSNAPRRIRLATVK